MALNLVRNSRVFFTTNVDATTGVVNNTGISTSNTFEIQVLDGFSFTQNTTSETVTLNEAGAAPSRGQRSFNTALDPVEFTMSTYMRPELIPAVADPVTAAQVIAEERWLWNAFAGTGPIAATGAGWTTGASSSAVSFANSNAHQLQKFGMILVVDNAIYIIDNCAMDQATIDFGIDAIATIAWTGRGTVLRKADASLSNLTFSGNDLGGTAAAKDTDAAYLANKLSVVTVEGGINASGSSDYSVPITGGSITFANNLTYLTPANLGVVNVPVTYFTGTRAVSGSLNAYLRTGSTSVNDTGKLLEDLLADSATNIDPGFEVTVKIGGTSGNRVEINMPAAVLQIPTVNTEQVVSTTINFTAQGSAATGNAYDIEAANEAVITYYAV